MLQNWLIMFPELSLLSYLAVAFLVNRYRQEKTAKTFFTLSKYFLGAALLSTVVFYNKSAFPDYWLNTPYAALFKITAYTVALVWFYLSSKWFLNKNRPSFRYYSLCMISLLLFGILLSARNFIVPVLLVPGLCLVTGSLMLLHWDREKVIPTVRLYAVYAGAFCLMLWCGAAVLFSETGSLDYDAVEVFLANMPEHQPLVYGAVLLIMSSLLFLMAAAPFHTWFVAMAENAVLPVSGFLTLIPPFVYLSCLISLMLGVFAPLEDYVRPALVSFAAFSLIIGAVSANGQKNIRTLFAFSSVYNLGFMLFGLINFNAASVNSAFAFTMIYVLSMLGVYTVFLGMKSRGEYLMDLPEISGISNVKPYISAAFLIFMVSLIGIPPMLGFLGRLSVINNLVLEERWGYVLLLVVALLFMANSYLQVIRAIYFEPLKNRFDRTDKAIYICLFVNLLVVLASILNPAYLLHDAEIVLGSVFQ